MAWYEGGCERGVKKGRMIGSDKSMSGDATDLLRKLVGFVVTIAPAIRYSTVSSCVARGSGTDRETKHMRLGINEFEFYCTYVWLKLFNDQDILLVDFPCFS
jgi:hypothetical protein